MAHEPTEKSGTELAPAAVEGTAAALVSDPDIAVHVNKKDIEKSPSGVGLRWCFNEATLKRMAEGLKQGYGYRVLIVARRAGDSMGVYEMRQVALPHQNFWAFDFKKPGQWEVGVVLFERTLLNTGGDTGEALERTMRSVLLRRMKTSREHATYVEALPDLGDIQKGEARVQVVYRRSGGLSIAGFKDTFTLKSDIFSPDPPEALLAFADYFFKTESLDDCMFVRRLVAVMVFPCFGFVPYLLLEVLKRMILFLFAMLLMLLGIKNWWRVGDIAFEPAVNVPLSVAGIDIDTFAEPYDRKGAKRFLPIMLLIYSGMAWLFLKFVLPVLVHITPPMLGGIKALGVGLWKFFFGGHHGKGAGPAVDPHLWTMLAHVLGITVVMVAIITVFAYLCGRMMAAWAKGAAEREKRKQTLREEARKRTLELGTLQAATALKFQSELVCGTTPATVSLEALPEELRPHRFSLWFTLVHKKTGCKSFG